MQRRDEKTWTLHAASDIIFNLVWCPPGVFQMGSDEADPYASVTERPRHDVQLTKGFWIGCTPVTQSQWLEILGEAAPLFHSGVQGKPLPAEGIPWDASMRFCRELTRRMRDRHLLREKEQFLLPTEAQWEYACRAGTQTRWHFGNEEADLLHYAWYRDNSAGQIHPVGQKRPNAWGLYDTYGNVAEWCLDDFMLYNHWTEGRADPAGEQRDSILKVARGGAFTHTAGECRTCSREAVTANNAYNESLGLRIVCQ